MHFKIGLIVLIVSCAATVRAEETEKDFIKAVDLVDNEKSVFLFGGLSVEKVENGRAYQPLASNALERVEQYLQTHELKWTTSVTEEEQEEGRSASAQEPRTRRIRKILLPLLLALKLKMVVVLKLAFMIIKFISIKALITGTLALIFAGGALLKDIIAKKKDRITTAYISGAPYNAEIVQSDWNRNGQASAQELAYGYHTIPQPVY